LRRYSLQIYSGVLRLGHKPECDFKISDCKKILVVRNKGIGDDIMALPALRLLRQYLPDTQIDLLVKPWNSTLFTDTGLFDNILIFERNAKTRVHGVRPYDTKTLIRKMREENYDAAVCIMGQEIGLRLSFYGGIPIIVCNEDYDKRYEFLITNKLKAPWLKDRLMSPVDACLDYIKQLGVPAESVPYGFDVIDCDRSHVQALLSERNIAKAYAVVHPCSSNPNKSWCPKRFSEIADYLVSKYDLDVVVSGSSGDTREADLVIENSEHRSRMCSLAGTLSLPQAAALYSSAAIMVTVDSGPMHIADAVGTPLVALFLPWNRNCRPYTQPGAVVLPDDPEFSALLESPDDTEWVNYMLRIPVDRVKCAVDVKMLEIKD